MIAFVKNHKILFSFFALLAAAILFILVLGAINYQKVSQGVSFQNQDLSGSSYNNAQNRIEASIQKVSDRPLLITYSNKQWQALPSDLGVKFDDQRAIQEAWQFGHDKNFLLSIAQQVQSLFTKKNIPLKYRLDQAKLDNFIQANLSSLQTPATNASWQYDPTLGAFSFISAKEGKVFDQNDLKLQIEQALSSSGQKSIELSPIPQKPILLSDPNNAAKNQAERIIEMAPYELKNGSSTWPIEQQILTDWLTFGPAQNSPQTMDVALSQDAIKDFLAQLAPGINQEPVNATLTFKDSKVQTFALSQNGIELNIDQSAQIISNEILSGEKEIDLDVEVKEPQITTETLDTLGLTDLLGVGTSTFIGSTKNRIYNIGIGAAKISGIVIDPGQEFSIIQALGEIDASTGYVPELVIKGKQTIPEYGGGLCQVSTTLFRAAIYAGLKITERYPHAFPVHYYNPQGFDATIYPPHPDMRFINDTPNHILVQSKIKGNVITFEIYGTSDGRQVKVDGPIILSSSPDGSMKTVLYQEIWQNGALLRKDTFRSNYKSPSLYPVVKNPLE